MNPTPTSPIPYPRIGFLPFVEVPQLFVTFGNLCCSPSVFNDPRVTAALGYTIPIGPPPRFQHPS
jgi:hypothetical protein